MQNHPNNCICGCHDQHKDTTGDDLFSQIEMDCIQCLNQRAPNSCKNIIRPISEALTPSSDVKLISNQDDPDLLLQLAFSQFVRIRSIIVIGGPGQTAPTRMKVFVNNNESDISLLQVVATQVIDLNPEGEGFVLEYPTKITKFNNVGCISLGFDQNVGGDDQSTQIQFIGFRGQVIKGKKGAIVKAVYQSKPNLKDHQVSDKQKVIKDLF